MKRIRVLQVLQGGQSFGGVESFLCQYYSHIDRRKVHFDFLLCTLDSMDSRWDSLGFDDSRRYVLNLNARDSLRIYKALLKHFKRHHYDAVHINTGNISIQLPCLRAAKKAGIACRIAHSHSTGGGAGSAVRHFVQFLPQRMIYNLATVQAGCSIAAARHIFGESVPQDSIVLIPNAIDAGQYSYSESVRTEIREDFGLQGKRVFIQVGNFSHVKNHPFTIRAFSRLLKTDPNCCLLFVGDGELRKEMETLVQSLGIEQSVRFCGYRNDVNRLLQAADCLLLPSFWEGFPMAALEAQAAGLKCICSDRVPQEVKVTDLCSFISLDQDKWIDECLKPLPARRDMCLDIMISGYDIRIAAERLENLYVNEVCRQTGKKHNGYTFK